MMHKVTFSDPVVAGEHLNTALRSDTGWRNYMKPWTTSTIDCRLDVYMKYYVRERLVVVGVLVLAVFAPAAATVADGGLKEEVQKAKRHQPWEEADDDAVFAAAVLGELHDTIRVVGDVFRIVGDTAGALTGGSIKAVGAAVNGISSVLDAASSKVDSKPKTSASVHNRDQSSEAATTTSHEHGGSSYDGRMLTVAPSGLASKTRRAREATEQSSPPPDPTEDKTTKGGDKGEIRKGAPNPLDKMGTVVRTSLAGSLRLVGAAVRGVGEAVFQAGTVAEGLAGGTGMVAEDLVRVVQGALYMARDDMENFSNAAARKGQGDGYGSKTIDRRKNEGDRTQTPAAVGVLKSLSPEKNMEKVVDDQEAGVVKTAASLASAAVDAVRRFWQVVCSLTCLMAGAALREAAQLFRQREGGAPPVAPRLAFILVLALGSCVRRRRLRRSSQPSPPQVVETSPARETFDFSSPRRRLSVPPGLGLGFGLAPTLSPSGNDHSRNNPPPSVVPPTASATAAAAALTSPSRSLSLGSPRPTHGTMPPRAVVSPSRLPLQVVGSIAPLTDDIVGVDPSLPSPAQQARGNPLLLPRTSIAGPREEESGAVGLVEGGDVATADGEAATAAAAVGVGRRVTARWRPWRWWRMEGRVAPPLRRQNGDTRSYIRWLWLLLLWFAASVLEERERDRVAWLAWDDGFRKGQMSRVFNSSAELETAIWLNHLIGGLWGRGGTIELVGRRSGGRVDGGLSSYVSEWFAEGVLEALEEFKPTSVVAVELQDINLGTVAPQILGIQMLDPSSSASPGGGDGSYQGQHAENFVSFRVALELATRGLSVGVGVKLSSLKKALLPTGNIRLLEAYFRGSISVRLEVRDEFPFVGKALVAFDGAPEVRVRMEQWGLDALTLGSVDEWVRIGLRQAMKPYVLPGLLEINAAEHLCPDCAPPSAKPVGGSNTEPTHGGSSTTIGSRFQLPSSAPTTLSNGDLPILSAPSDTATPAPAGAEPLRRAPPAAAGAAKAVFSAVASASYFPKAEVDNIALEGKPLRGTAQSSGGGDGRLRRNGNVDGTGKGKDKRGKGQVGDNERQWSAAGTRAVAPGGGSDGGSAVSGADVCEASARNSARSIGEERVASRGCGKQEAERRTIGRAAAMAEVYDDHSGMGGTLQWVKDRLADRIGGGSGDGVGGRRWRDGGEANKRDG